MAALLAGALTTAVGIAALIGEDNNKREAFTQNFIKEASAKIPGFNVVICHPQHWIAVSNPHVVHEHYELKMTAGTCGYDIYASPIGQPFAFVNQGDGGYMNWAFAGEMTGNGNQLDAVVRVAALHMIASARVGSYA